MVAVWIALLWPPLPVGAPSPLAAFSLLLVPSFLSLPNQPANILNGALVVIEILSGRSKLRCAESLHRAQRRSLAAPQDEPSPGQHR